MKYVSIDGETAIIRVAGRYDLVKTMVVDKELKSALQSGCQKILVDFGETKFSDSSVNRQLKKVRSMVGGDNFKIINCTGAVLKSMQTARLDKVFNIQ